MKKKGKYYSFMLFKFKIENVIPIKVCISPNELSTDQVTTRGKAASHPPSPLPHSDDQFASF
uniref:Uncharacterized protein n=1 Tax=Heterorhabditis bacteriophora TaxID=37862 RepID=A0A1I7WU68_HETBA